MKVRIVFLCLIWFSLLSVLQAQLPEDFYDLPVRSDFDFPLGLTFDGQGRMYVWEKKGRVFIVDTTGERLPQPLIDITEEVSDWKDHGLNYFTLDPDFLQNGYFYLYYVVDPHHLFNYGTPAYHPDSTITHAPSIGRVTRYQADPATGFTTTLPGSRKVLLGESPSTGIPILWEFHGLGTMLFGEDGSLLLSAGEGSNGLKPYDNEPDTVLLTYQALQQGLLGEDEAISSYRAQYLGSPNGKILRIDPETGDGLPSNPFFDPENPRSAQSRTYALGLRNPYRFALLPGTGSHYPADGRPGVLLIGDVGAGAWEELDVATRGGQNFGWPLFEGIFPNWTLWNQPAPPNPQAPNPLYDGANCTQEFLTFRDLLARTNADPQLAVATNPCDPAQPIPPELRPMVETLPALTWSNKNWNKPARAFVPIFKETDGRPTGVEIIDPRSPIEGDNFEGFSSLGGVVYTAESFPPEYRGKYFHFDFSGWIQIFHFDEQHRLVAVEPFHRNPKDLIHLALNPRDGCLYYIRLTGGQIRKICYGGNPPPVAVIEHSQNFGGSTLEVQFDASKSYDPNGLPLSYHWDFGDGNTSTLPAPTHTFSTSGTAPRSFRVTLTVTDSLGAADSSFAIVSLNNTPPQVTITSFEDGDRYPLDGPSVLALQAHVEDAEHPREQLHWRWQAFLHHNDHYHPDPPLETPAAYAFISPLGCEEETYWYRIELTVTDPEGLATTVTQNIYPNCDGAFTALNLTGESFEDHLRLSWSSADESGVRQYLLQRSADGLHFETLRTFPALGVPSTYAFEDRSPLLGSNIYRVKALGPDGAYQYSNWLTLSFPPEPDLRVFPNPVRQTANFHLREAFDERVRIRLFDPQGATLLDRSFEAQPGERFEQSLLLPHLGNGLYFYLLENGAFRKGGSIVVLKG